MSKFTISSLIWSTEVYSVLMDCCSTGILAAAVFLLFFLFLFPPAALGVFFMNSIASGSIAKAVI